MDLKIGAETIVAALDAFDEFGGEGNERYLEGRVFEPEPEPEPEPVLESIKIVEDPALEQPPPAAETTAEEIPAAPAAAAAPRSNACARGCASARSQLQRLRQPPPQTETLKCALSHWKRRWRCSPRCWSGS